MTETMLKQGAKDELLNTLFKFEHKLFASEL